MDIYFGYVWIWIWWISKRISKIHIHEGYPCLLWIPNNPTWISCLDIHNIHDIQRTELYERVDEDYICYPEVHYFHDKLNECEQSLMVAWNELDTSQRSIKQLESSIKGSLRGVDWAREYYYEMAEELNRDKTPSNFCTWTLQQSYGPFKLS